jgi:hypothetical protein
MVLFSRYHGYLDSPNPDIYGLIVNVSFCVSCPGPGLTRLPSDAHHALRRGRWLIPICLCGLFHMILALSRGHCKIQLYRIPREHCEISRNSSLVSRFISLSFLRCLTTALCKTSIVPPLVVLFCKVFLVPSLLLTYYSSGPAPCSEKV